jgi:antitoxin component of MazEF toxin-antitoxin module
MQGTFRFGPRRVVRMGYSRFVTLPKDWLRNAGVGEGGAVDLAMDGDGNLIITPVKEVPSS